VCSGFYTQSSYNPIDVHCTRHMSGYTFSLPDTLRDELLPSVKSLADEITPGTYNTAPWITLLYIGLILAIFDLLLLPWTWFGTKRLNGYCLGLAVVLTPHSHGVHPANSNVDFIPNPSNLRLACHRAYPQRPFERFQHHLASQSLSTHPLNITISIDILGPDLGHCGLHNCYSGTCCCGMEV
jgi:hypothetical protein